MPSAQHSLFVILCVIFVADKKIESPADWWLKGVPPEEWHLKGQHPFNSEHAVSVSVPVPDLTPLKIESNQSRDGRSAP